MADGFPGGLLLEEGRKDMGKTSHKKVVQPLDNARKK